MKKETKNKNDKKTKTKEDSSNIENIEQLKEEEANEIFLLGNRIKELEEKLMRNQAELINFKKRTESEVSKMLKYQEEEVIEELLPILDNFERALKEKNVSEEVKKYLEGFEMIYEAMKTLLEKFEVKEINSLDKEFDPMYHEAVMTEKNEEKEKNIVTEVLQKGYTYKDKVIRPSMVKVNN